MDFGGGGVYGEVRRVLEDPWVLTYIEVYI